ncbi:hypothetical protein FRC10_001204 [Ceratobasidium sp. 414]|nr:hypothetical protein FRC10_001204 [Ceratobasidium sp. 414]
MSKLFAKFTKSPNSQATLSPQSAHGESALRTGSIDSPRHPFPISPSPLRTAAQPKVILTSESSEATAPTSPGSLHRQSSLGTSLEDVPRKNSLSAAQRQAFADQIARTNGVAVPDDLQTPRAAAPVSPQPRDQNSTPKANGLRPSPPPPPSEVKSPTPALLPPANVQDSPSVRKQTSATSLTAPPPASRSRRGSAASSDAGSTSGRNINTQVAAATNPLMLVESPTSDKPLFASPRNSSEGTRSPTRSMTKPKPSKARTWRARGGSGSAGGIAGALAQSGMSLALNPGLTAAAAPPLPTKQLTRAATAVSAIHRVPSDTSIKYSGGGVLSKTFSRGSRSRGHESSDSESYDSEDALSFGPEEMPITGFAVASSKRNFDFHELFPTVPEGDYLIEDYGCALQREILIQGRLYISENHMCFNANIFGWITNFIIPFHDVTGLEKKMTAYVIPNAIQICTRTVKYTFASFLSRDTTYDVVNNIWRLSHPRSPNALGSSADLPSTEGGVEMNGAAAGPAKHRPTQCACGKEGKHFDLVVIDTVLPGTPEKIYNLMFASGFVKDFMAGEQKLIDIQISDWHPEQSGTQLLTRNMSYIKPLNGSIGPKSTKCELKDETVHVDFDDYVSTLTTTRTPDVPSGGVFSVKTRTCIMWAGAATSRLVVSTTVEWTGRSFIRSIIDKSAIDGQKQYHNDLEKAMRNYIAAHRTEFVPDDAADGAAEEALAVGDTTISPENNAADAAQSKAERVRATELRGLQWILDTFTGASNVAVDAFWGAVDLIGDLIADLPGTTLLGAVVAILVISNIWTMFSLREARARAKLDQKRAALMDERGGVGVGGADASVAVQVLLEEVLRGRREKEQTKELVAEATADPRAEAEALRRSVEALEARVEKLKKSLVDLD